MEEYLPISLKGDNLGQRHRYLNALVTEVSGRNVAMDTFENIPEHSPVDRLFKIDLASKLRNTGYIIQNIKDDDMLYVSRALKAKWLLNLEYIEVINPKYLEEVLFPEMITTAITKMKHWLYIHLRDHERCSEFYQYYKERSFNFAIKFLYHCNGCAIKREFPNILTKLSPHHLKIFSEVCPELAKIYFDALAKDSNVAEIYLKDEEAYLRSVNSLLNSNPDIFQNITETYYGFKLNSAQTAHIMRHHKNWFTVKSEYYTACLLHIPTLAKYLTSEESEEVIVQLARADYLSWWFSYQNVEPLVKRISPSQRAAFKKRVFVDKDVGIHIHEWPYATPAGPTVQTSEPHVFDDQEHSPWDFGRCDFRSMLCKRKYSKWQECSRNVKRVKSELDHIFDEFRFAGFDRTFHELSRRLGAVSSMESRRSIFLVLVSKTGGRFDSMSVLLELLARHINEPCNLRAAIIRSIVKRACVWRLPDETWTKLIKFGHGLGLDGGPAEDDCREGLHAVVLRHLLSGNNCDENLRVSFLANFSSFSEYLLTANERTLMIASMTRLLVTRAAESEPKVADKLLRKLFKVYEQHRVRVDASSEIVRAVIALVERDHLAARKILSMLYNARVARKELFSANILFIHEDREYLNVLRHNPQVISPVYVIEQLSSKESPCFDQFMRKAAIYFAEKGGLSELMVNALTSEIASHPNAKLVRPLVTIFRGDLKTYLQGFEASNYFAKRHIAAALRANVHRARPKIDIDSLEMYKIGAKAMANQSFVCRNVDVEKRVRKLLTWRRTVRIALTLAQRESDVVGPFAKAVTLRPQAALKAALLYLGGRGKDADTRIWDLVKPQVPSLYLLKTRHFNRAVSYVEQMPSTIKVDYCVTLFITIYKKKSAIDLLYRDLDKILPDMNNEQIDIMVSTMIENHNQDECSILYVSTFIKYFLLCKTEREQTRRLENIGQYFLDCLRKLVVGEVETNLRKKRFYTEHLSMTLEGLKCNRVFFDSGYVSCLPLFKRILTWMKEICPIENYFNKYAEIHLTMLYYLAIKHGIDKAPDIFGDPDKKLNEGVDIVGVLFGRYIARDLRELIVHYFESIIDLYKDAVQYYMNSYFIGDSSKKQFISAVINGILEESTGKECRVVVYLIQYVDLSETTRKLMEGNEEIQFFMYAMK